MTSEYDLIICGAGPVGLALAIALVQRGVAPQRICLLDAREAAAGLADPRSLAMSYGSRQMLEQLGAWPIAAQAIEQIHVSRRGHFGRTLIDCADYQLPALGYVTHYGTLLGALDRAAREHALTVLRPRQVVQTTEHPDRIDVNLSDGTSCRTALLVQAEGGVFAQQPARARHYDYQQTALVTHVQVSAPLLQRAFERFTAEGPLALLPQDGGYAVVWCMAQARAEQLSRFDDAAFLRELEQTFGGRVGRFLQVGERATYRLGLNADSAATARTIAIGNAAQTLHPVAGQGLNLGLRDATVLARLLAQEMTPAALNAFSRERRTDRQVAIGVTDAMARVFASAPDGAISQGVLALALGALDLVAPARAILARQMMFGWRSAR